jgi:hypothetical protein
MATLHGLLRQFRTVEKQTLEKEKEIFDSDSPVLIFNSTRISLYCIVFLSCTSFLYSTLFALYQFSVPHKPIILVGVKHQPINQSINLFFPIFCIIAECHIQHMT